MRDSQPRRRRSLDGAKRAVGALLNKVTPAGVRQVSKLDLAMASAQDEIARLLAALSGGKARAREVQDVMKVLPGHIRTLGGRAQDNGNDKEHFLSLIRLHMTGMEGTELDLLRRRIENPADCALEPNDPYLALIRGELLRAIEAARPAAESPLLHEMLARAISGQGGAGGVATAAQHLQQAMRKAGELIDMPHDAAAQRAVVMDAVEQLLAKGINSSGVAAFFRALPARELMALASHGFDHELPTHPSVTQIITDCIEAEYESAREGFRQRAGALESVGEWAKRNHSWTEPPVKFAQLVVDTAEHFRRLESYSMQAVRPDEQLMGVLDALIRWCDLGQLGIEHFNKLDDALQTLGSDKGRAQLAAERQRRKERGVASHIELAQGVLYKLETIRHGAGLADAVTALKQARRPAAEIVESQGGSAEISPTLFHAELADQVKAFRHDRRAALAQLMREPVVLELSNAITTLLGLPLVQQHGALHRELKELDEALASVRMAAGEAPVAMANSRAGLGDGRHFSELGPEVRAALAVHGIEIGRQGNVIVQSAQAAPIAPAVPASATPGILPAPPSTAEVNVTTRLNILSTPFIAKESMSRAASLLPTAMRSMKRDSNYWEAFTLYVDKHLNTMEAGQLAHLRRNLQRMPADQRDKPHVRVILDLLAAVTADRSKMMERLGKLPSHKLLAIASDDSFGDFADMAGQVESESMERWFLTFAETTSQLPPWPADSAAARHEFAMTVIDLASQWKTFESREHLRSLARMADRAINNRGHKQREDLSARLGELLGAANFANWNGGQVELMALRGALVTLGVDDDVTGNIDRVLMRLRAAARPVASMSAPVADDEPLPPPPDDDEPLPPPSDDNDEPLPPPSDEPPLQGKQLLSEFESVSGAQAPFVEPISAEAVLIEFQSLEQAQLPGMPGRFARTVIRAAQTYQDYIEHCQAQALQVDVNVTTSASSLTERLQQQLDSGIFDKLSDDTLAEFGIALKALNVPDGPERAHAIERHEQLNANYRATLNAQLREMLKGRGEAIQAIHQISQDPRTPIEPDELTRDVLGFNIPETELTRLFAVLDSDVMREVQNAAAGKAGLERFSQTLAMLKTAARDLIRECELLEPVRDTSSSSSGPAADARAELSRLFELNFDDIQRPSSAATTPRRLTTDDPMAKILRQSREALGQKGRGSRSSIQSFHSPPRSPKPATDVRYSDSEKLLEDLNIDIRYSVPEDLWADLLVADYLVSDGSGPLALLIPHEHRLSYRTAVRQAAVKRLLELTITEKSPEGSLPQLRMLSESATRNAARSVIDKVWASKDNPVKLPDGTPGKVEGQENVSFTLVRNNRDDSVRVTYRYVIENLRHFQPAGQAAKPVLLESDGKVAFTWSHDISNLGKVTEADPLQIDFKLAPAAKAVAMERAFGVVQDQLTGLQNEQLLDPAEFIRNAHAALDAYDAYVKLCGERDFKPDDTLPDQFSHKLQKNLLNGGFAVFQYGEDQKDALDRLISRATMGRVSGRVEAAHQPGLIRMAAAKLLGSDIPAAMRLLGSLKPARPPASLAGKERAVNNRIKEFKDVMDGIAPAQLRELAHALDTYEVPVGLSNESLSNDLKYMRRAVAQVLMGPPRQRIQAT